MGYGDLSERIRSGVSITAMKAMAVAPRLEVPGREDEGNASSDESCDASQCTRPVQSLCVPNGERNVE
jgi:hypothetical protein